MSQTDLLKKYAAPVPRYTSYPTAPHFSEAVDVATYRSWLADLPDDAALSLYLHIPFCDTLCWFCGCQTRHIRRYEPVATYLPFLVDEIEAVGRLVGSDRRVAHIHWGGGSPTILRPDDICMLAGALRGAFAVDEEAEFAVEVDPRGFGAEEARALGEAGLTRVSIGVQDFNPRVQKAINRIQTFEETAHTVKLLREAGIGSLNIDLIYGLPYQSKDDLAVTIDKSIALGADRFSVFGYAHVPWMKTHQKMIPEESLPGVMERFEQMAFVAERLVAAGYAQIGIDHFARPDDALAEAASTGRLQRNFQGYTTDAAEALIGLGASAISRLPQGYAQNERATGRYQAAIAETGLATSKGIALSDEDRMRGWFIERLLSDFCVSRAEMESRFGDQAGVLAREASELAAEEDELIIDDGGEFRISDHGRPFARAVAARFDSYLKAGAARHSSAV